jgi:hypothetical protein
LFSGAFSVLRTNCKTCVTGTPTGNLRFARFVAPVIVDALLEGVLWSAELVLELLWELVFGSGDGERRNHE